MSPHQLGMKAQFEKHRNALHMSVFADLYSPSSSIMHPLYMYYENFTLSLSTTLSYSYSVDGDLVHRQLAI